MISFRNTLLNRAVRRQVSKTPKVTAKKATSEKPSVKVQEPVPSVMKSSDFSYKIHSAKDLRKQLDESEKKIVREELFLSIQKHPGFTLDDHAKKLGITSYLAKKCFASLNCLRLLKKAKS
uniref:Uncharacterized protein n=1 Tax=Paramoeba aestuarina TaxID=180227 RepID=A0A7S4PLL7_9EUKA|mmetsp:Transcript_8151/g.12326  ORF Transcript_8151/g.12326 Transcript_8151/m.12326 type:complete len:121 (+) Transcript_8151:253-615(+)